MDPGAPWFCVEPHLKWTLGVFRSRDWNETGRFSVVRDVQTAFAHSVGVTPLTYQEVSVEMAGGRSGHLSPAALRRTL